MNKNSAKLLIAIVLLLIAAGLIAWQMGLFSGGGGGGGGVEVAPTAPADGSGS